MVRKSWRSSTWAPWGMLSCPPDAKNAADTAAVTPELSRRPEGATRVVNLTIDDGPDGKRTPTILELLKDNNVKATLCMLGNTSWRPSPSTPATRSSPSTATSPTRRA
ncbi:polysaccharide deacetylase family protein [Streptomyces sp. NPDC001704]